MDLQTYKIRRGSTHHASTQMHTTDMSKSKSSKYTQVCDSTTMTDEKYSLYQNVGTITSPLQDHTPTSTTSSTSTLRQHPQYPPPPMANQQYHQRHVPASHSYLQRTLSDPHCPDFINSSEELLGMYDNTISNKNYQRLATSTSINNPENPDVLGYELYRTYSPPTVYSPTQNKYLCNCDLKEYYYQRPKSRQSSLREKYSSDQNIVQSAQKQQSNATVYNNRYLNSEQQFLAEQQYSLDRKLINRNQSPAATSSGGARLLKKTASSLRKNNSGGGSPTRHVARNYIPCVKQASEKRSEFGRSQSYIIQQKSLDETSSGSAVGYFIDRGQNQKQYSSLRRQKSYLEDQLLENVPPQTEFITRSGSGKSVERYSTASTTGTGLARSSTGSSRGRGNMTSESELDDDPEMIFDLSTAGVGHLADCQCPCDHIGTFGQNYQMQKEHCFPPAPDVTRRLQTSSESGGTTGANNTACTSTATSLKPEVTFYRSASTPATCSNSSSSASGSSKIDLSNRHWWVIVTVLLLAAAAGVGVPIALRISAGASLEERMEFASRLLQEVPLIDGHNDLPWNIRKFLHNRLKDFKFGEDLRNVSPWSQSAWSHTDLPRLKQGHVAAQFWAAYVPCESQHRDAVQLTLEQIDVIRRFTEQYHPQLTLCTSAEEIRVAHQRHQLCSLIGVEGGHSLANSLAVLRTLYQVGVRYLTLTSTCNTPWADCSLVDIPGRKAEHGGLTNFGKTIVKEMNRLGMIVDLSHVSERTMRDALAVSKAPVIFSHSSAHALCNSTRNVPDGTLRKLALNRGIVMVNFYSQFLTCKDVATVADAVAHINHIRDVAGVDNVGLGAGYDGINYTPKGLEDVSSYPALFAELIGSGGWSTEDLKKLAGLNFLRVMTDVERVRDEFRQAKVPPYEDLSPRVKNNNCSSHDLF